MTHAEKMLNRHGLLAYKHKEEKHYALVPGISAVYERMDGRKYPEILKKKPDLTLKDKTDRLALYGYLRR